MEATTAQEAAAQAAAPQNGTTDGETVFNLELSQDQKDIREWVHGFAEGVVRPRPHEWDEREETPWPVIQEAAKIGLYGFEGLAQFWMDTDRSDDADRQRGALLGRRRNRAWRSWARPSRSPRSTPPGPLTSSPNGCRSATARPTTRRSAPSAPPSPTRAPTCRRSAQPRATTRPRDEWVLNGQKAWATNGGIAAVHVVIASVDRELGSRGHAGFVVPPGTKGLEQGSKVKKHGLRASHTADVHLDDCRIPGLVPARRQGEARRAPRPRPRGHELARPGGDEDLRGLTAHGRLAGGGHRPRRVRVRARLREGARSSSGARSSRTRRSRSRSPT